VVEGLSSLCGGISHCSARLDRLGSLGHPARNYQIDDYLDQLQEFLEQTTCSGPVTTVLLRLLLSRFGSDRRPIIQSLVLTTRWAFPTLAASPAVFFAPVVSIPILDRLLYSTSVATSNGIRSFLKLA